MNIKHILPVEPKPFTPEQWDALVTVIRANVLNAQGILFDVDEFKAAREKLVQS